MFTYSLYCTLRQIPFELNINLCGISPLAGKYIVCIYKEEVSHNIVLIHANLIPAQHKRNDSLLTALVF